MKLQQILFSVGLTVTLPFLFNIGPAKTPKIIMAVFAHADDEMNIGPLLAKYANEGNEVYLVYATKGEKGVQAHAGIPGGDSLAKAREAEANCASKQLGIRQPIFLRMGDGSLDEDFTGKPLQDKLDSVLRRYNPDIVISWGPEGGYGHSDHRMVSNAVTTLCVSGWLPRAPDLYYTGIPTSLWRKPQVYKTKQVNWFHELWKPVDDRLLTTRIQCTKAAIEKATKAYSCYRSQFEDPEIEDMHEWIRKGKNDTIYLRPAVGNGKMKYTLF